MKKFTVTNICSRMMVLFGMLLTSALLQAKFYVAEFDDDFRTYLKRHDFAVVLFDLEKEGEESENMEAAKDMFYDLSRESRYKKDGADVAFIGVDTANVPGLIEEFNLPKDKEEIAFVLFKGGQPIEESGKIVLRSGFIDDDRLETFIERYFGSAIDKILDRKEARQKELEKQEQEEEKVQKEQDEREKALRKQEREDRRQLELQRELDRERQARLAAEARAAGKPTIIQQPAPAPVTTERVIIREPRYRYRRGPIVRPWIGWGGRWGGRGWRRPWRRGGFGIGFGFGRGRRW